MINNIKSKYPLEIKISSSNKLDESITNSLFSFFLIKKLPKWVKYLLFIILSIINGYIFYNYLVPYISPYLSLSLSLDLLKLFIIIYILREGGYLID